MTDVCPTCGSEGRVVTAVTVPNLGKSPRSVLVTRQCLALACQFKYPVIKIETALADDERAKWRGL